MKHIPVENHGSLVRDRQTKAILNINSNEIKEAKARKSHRKNKDDEIEQLKNDVDTLKTLVNNLIKRET